MRDDMAEVPLDEADLMQHACTHQWEVSVYPIGPTCQLSRQPGVERFTLHRLGG